MTHRSVLNFDNSLTFPEVKVYILTNANVAIFHDTSIIDRYGHMVGGSVMHNIGILQEIVINNNNINLKLCMREKHHVERQVFNKHDISVDTS